MAELSGAQILVETLVEQGVEVIFGYPGGAVLPIYDALYGQDAIRHVLVRHEQGAGGGGKGAQFDHPHENRHFANPVIHPCSLHVPPWLGPYGYRLYVNLIHKRLAQVRDFVN